MDQVQQPIKEEDLFSYQRHKWLRNDREERDMRYVEFNLDALISRALRKGRDNPKPEGKECKFSPPYPDIGSLSIPLTDTGVKVTKLLEGDNNKTLLLTMNDGDEVIARLPNPIAGPSYFTVASEIATRRLISLTLDPIPMPRVWDWDFRHKNEVGAEWILEDKAAGLPLRQFWFNMDRKTQFYIVRQVVEIEKKLGAIRFPHHAACEYIGKHAADDLSTLSHPNLSLDNIFINPDDKRITCLTGWQGTVVSPPILKPLYPPFLDSKFETLSKNANEKQPRDLYRKLIKEADPLRYDRIYENPKEYHVITAPLSAIRCSYEAQTTFELRESIINFIDYYDSKSGEKSLPDDSKTPTDLIVQTAQTYLWMAVCSQKISRQRNAGLGTINIITSSLRAGTNLA
ncbi:hypothetical protein PISL3812_03372 [Talaromyces islandicus]|uniref:Altered inheritance of mitochondria protein 9, mitochondrial n=1 Tax=Talaromyces islandicus TaxID=28573 RepID=A0A0U1LUA9_TALIS|nr:hypothetical protein PISL3812_03372 [Talaromyces islandicus]